MNQTAQSLTDKQKLIPTKDLIIIAKKAGVKFGHGNPINRLRYFTKTGLLPHAQRKQTGSHDFTEGHYPAYTVDLLLSIQQLKKAAKPSAEIAKTLASQRLKYEITQTARSLGETLTIKELPSSFKFQVSSFKFQVRRSLAYSLAGIASLAFLALVLAFTPNGQTYLTQIKTWFAGKILTSTPPGKVAGIESDSSLRSSGQALFLPTSQNLLANSSFENPSGLVATDGQGKTKFGQAWRFGYLEMAHSGNFYVSTESIRSGTLAMKVWDSGVNGNRMNLGITQKETTTINGRNYILSVFLRSKDLVGNPKLRLGFMNKTNSLDHYEDFVIAGTDGWTPFSFSYENTPLGAYPFIEIVDYQGGVLFLDDAVLVETAPRQTAQNSILASQDNVLRSYSYANGQDYTAFLSPFKTIGFGSQNTDSSADLYPADDSMGSIGMVNKRFATTFVNDADVKNSLKVGGPAEFLNNLKVQGAATISGNLSLDNAKFSLNSSQFNTDIAPAENNKYNLGSFALNFNDLNIKNIYTSGNVGVGTTNPGAFKLNVQGNTNINGSLTTTGGITATGDLLPSTDATYNLGSATARWQDLWLSRNALVNGNLGVGTTNPTAKLDVNGNTNLTGTLTVTGSNLTTLGGNLTVTGTAWTATPTISGLITATSGLTANSTVTVNSNFLQTTAINNGFAGNVGIGTTVPLNKLDVSGSVAFGALPTTALPQANSAYFSGNVGIGTTAPSAKLDIIGNLAVSSYATVSASLGVGTSAALGVGNLNILNDLTVGGSTVLGTSTSQNLTVNGYIISDLIPKTESGNFNLGSNTRRWDNVWANTVTASNISGTVVTGSTSAFDWMIGAGQTTADTQDITITLERGTPATNAELRWNSTSKWLSTNVPTFFISPDSGITPSGKSALIVDQIQSQDILTASASAVTKLVLTNAGNLGLAGNLGVGTTSPTQTVDIAPASSILTFSSSTGVKQIQTGGTTNLALMPGGNVGIGTTAPAQLLAVGSSSQFNVSSTGAVVGVGINSGSGLLQGTGGITITGTGNINATGTSATNIGNSTGILTLASGGASGWTNTSGDLTFKTLTSGNILLNSVGNVGIGSTAPAAAPFLFVGSTGNVGIGTTAPAYKLEVNGTLGVGSTANFSSLVNISGLNASQAVYTDASKNLTSAIPTSGSLGFWQRNSTTVAPATISDYIGIGTTSALNPLSVSGSVAFGVLPGAALPQANSAYFSGNIGIGTTNPLTYSINAAGDINIASTKAYYINGTSVLNATTLGTGVLASSLTSVGALTGGSIASGFGTIATANTITGTTLNGTTGINTGAGAGTLRLDSSGALSNITSLTLSGAISGGTTYSGSGNITSTAGLISISGAGNNYLAGNLGIGTTTPTYQLQLTGTLGVGSTATFSSLVNITGLNASQAVYTDASKNLTSAIPTTGALGYWQRNGTNVSPATITDFVGIGTTGPLSNLGVLGNLSVGATYGNFAAQTSGAIFEGNVGIGTTTPGAKLDVNGTLTVTGSNLTTLGGNLTVTGTAWTATPTISGLITATSGLTANSTVTVNSNFLQTTAINNGFAGNVGIGTTVPLNKLDVSGSVAFGSLPTTALPQSNSAYFSGNVGIGITAPTKVLDVNGDINIATAKAYYIAGTSVLNGTTLGSGVTASSLTSIGTLVSGAVPASLVTAGTFGTGAYTMDTSLTNPLLIGGTTTTSTLTLQTTSGVGTTNADMHFNVGNNGATKAMTILNSGNVGIGTTAPLSKLGVLGNGAIGATYGAFAAPTSGMIIEGNVGIGTTGPGAKLEVSGAASATPVTNGILKIDTTGTVSTGYGGGLLFAQNADSGTLTNYASITGSRVNSGLNNAVDLVFSTGNPTDTTAVAERMRITTNGNVGIGTTGPAVPLHVIGEVRATAYSFTAISASGLDNPSGYNLSLHGQSNVDGDILMRPGWLSGTSSFRVQNNTTDVFTVGLNGTTYMSGNVGIGTTAPLSKLGVLGNGAIGATYGAFAAPTSGMIIEGNVGIGTTGPGATLHVVNATSDALVASIQGNSSSGVDRIDFLNVSGIGNHMVLVGQRIAGGTGASGAAIDMRNTFGNNNYAGINIGTADINFVTTDASVGTNRMVIKGTSGNVGIGTTAPLSKLGVLGNGAIGATYGAFAAPTSGMIIEGNVGIGTTGPGTKLEVQGTLRVNNAGAWGGSSLQLGTDDNWGMDTYDGTGTDDQLRIKFADTGDRKLVIRGTNSNTDLVTVNSSGNVGIGTTAPGAQLHVVKGATTDSGIASSALELSRTTGASENLAFRLKSGAGISGTTFPGQIISDGNNIMEIYTSSGAPIVFGTNGTENVRIANGGNVGIGTTGPSSKLQVYSTTATQALFNGWGDAGARDASGQIQIGNHTSYHGTLDYSDLGNTTFTIKNSFANSASLMKFTMGSTDAMAILGTGNVGIGTTGPSYKLDVRGGTVAGAGAYVDTSSHSSLKENFQNVPVLDTIGKLRINSWQYKTQFSNGDFSTHLYPTTDDFYAAFSLGRDEFTISPEDIAGVALKGVQEVSLKLDETGNLISTQSATLASQGSTLQGLDARISSLENKYASLSAQLATASASLSPLSDLGNLETATISGTLTVLGKTLLSDLGVTGNITAGLLTIDGLNGEINSLAGPLKLQSLALANLEMMGGKVVIDTKGNLVVTGEITAKKYNLDLSEPANATASAVLSASAGKIEIPAGQTELSVQTSSLTPNSMIFVTPENLPVAVSASASAQTSFTIKLEKPLSDILKVSWWIVN